MSTPTVHNPTNFEPKDYEVVDYLDNKRPEYFGQSIPVWELEIKEWEADMMRVLGSNWRAIIHKCIHCGNGSVRWITAVRHFPTNETVVFGAICTERLGFADKMAFKLAQLQARAEARKVRFTMWNTRQAFLTLHPEIVAALAAITNPVHAKNAFVQDVLRKLDQYGSLSDKQVNAVVNSLARDIAYAAKKATEATEVKGGAPSGRVNVTGVVVSLKDYESSYNDGVVSKMLIKLDTNAKVFCTVPSRETIERGDLITVCATWTVSATDKSFATGKRPILIARIPQALTATTPEPVTVSGVKIVDLD